MKAMEQTYRKSRKVLTRLLCLVLCFAMCMPAANALDICATPAEIIEAIRIAAASQPDAIKVYHNGENLANFRDSIWRGAVESSCGIEECDWSWSKSELWLESIVYQQTLSIDSVVNSIVSAAQSRPTVIVVDCETSHLDYFRDAQWRANVNAAAGIVSCEWSWSTEQLTLSGIVYPPAVTLEEVVEYINEAAANRAVLIEVTCDVSHLDYFRDAQWRANVNAAAGIASCEWSWSTEKLTLSNIKYVELISLEEVVANINAAAAGQPAKIEVACEASHLNTFRNAQWRAAVNASAGIAGCEWSWSTQLLTLTEIRYVERVTLDEVIANVRVAAETQPATIEVECDVSHLPTFRDAQWRAETNAAVGIASCEWSWSNTKLTLSNIKYVERVTLEEVIASIRAAAETQPAKIEVACDVSHLPTFRDNAWRVETNKALGIASCEWSWGNTKLTLSNIKYVERVTLEEVIASIRAAAETQPSTIEVACDVSHLPTFRDNAWRVETNKALGIASCEWSWGNTKLTLSNIKYVERMTLDEVIASIRAAAETQPSSIEVACDVSHLAYFRDAAWRASTNAAVGIAGCEWNWANTKLTLTNIRYVERMTLDEVIESIRQATAAQPDAVTVAHDVSHLPTFRDAAWRAATNAAVGIARCDWNWSNTELHLTGIQYIERMPLEEVQESIVSAALARPVSITVAHDVSHIPSLSDAAWRAAVCSEARIVSCNWDWSNTELWMTEIVYEACITPEEIIASIEEAAMAKPASITVEHDSTQFDSIRDAAWRSAAMRSAGIAGCEWNWSTREIWLTNIRYINAAFCTTEEDVRTAVLGAQNGSADVFLSKEMYAALTADSYRALYGIVGYAGVLTCDVAANADITRLIEIRNMTYTEHFERIESAEQLRAYMNARALSGDQKFGFYYTAEAYAELLKDHSKMLHLIEKESGITYADMTDHVDKSIMVYQNVQYYPGYFDYVNSAAKCETQADVQTALMNPVDGRVILHLTEELYSFLTADDMREFDSAKACAGVISCGVTYVAGNRCLWEVYNLSYLDNFELITSVEQLKSYFAQRSAELDDTFGFGCTEEVYAALTENDFALLRSIEKENCIDVNGLTADAANRVFSYSGVSYTEGYAEFLSTAVKCGTVEEMKAALESGSTNLHLTEELLALVTENDQAQLHELEGSLGMIERELSYLGGNARMWQYAGIVYANAFEQIDSEQALIAYLQQRTKNADGQFAFRCTDDFWQDMRQADAKRGDMEAFAGIADAETVAYDHLRILSYTNVQYYEGFDAFVQNAVFCTTEEEFKAALESAREDALDLYLSIDLLKALEKDGGAQRKALIGSVGLYAYAMENYAGNDYLWRLSGMEFITPFAWLESKEQIVLFIGERMQAGDVHFGFGCDADMLTALTENDNLQLRTLELNAGMKQCEREINPETGLIRYENAAYYPAEYLDFLSMAVDCRTVDEVAWAVSHANGSVNLHLSEELHALLSENSYGTWHLTAGRAGLTDYRLGFYGDNLSWWQITNIDRAENFACVATQEELRSYVQQRVSARDESFAFACDEALFASFWPDGLDSLHTLLKDCGVVNKLLTCYGNRCLILCSEVEYSGDTVQLDNAKEILQHISEKADALQDSFTFTVSKSMYKSLDKKDFAQVKDMAKNCGILLADITCDDDLRQIKFDNIEYMPGKRIVTMAKKGFETQLSNLEYMAYQTALGMANRAKSATEGDYELFHMLHDQIIAQITYEIGHKYDNEKYSVNETVLGALIYGRAQSSGYADAMYLVGSLAGLKVDYQCGACLQNSAEEAYVWNLITYDDKTYFVDLARDDVGTAATYGMSNIGTALASDNYTWDEDAAVKKPEKKTSEAYYYYEHENCVFSSYDKACEYMNKQAAEGARSVSFRFEHNGKQDGSRIVEELKKGLTVSAEFSYSEAKKLVFVYAAFN